jgi:hypothetical protein
MWEKNHIKLASKNGMEIRLKYSIINVPKLPALIQWEVQEQHFLQRQESTQNNKDVIWLLQKLPKEGPITTGWNANIVMLHEKIIQNAISNINPT